MFEGFDGWLRAKDDEGVKPYTVSEFLAHCNLVLEREFTGVLIEGEVASFKINQGKWVFFDLKDAETSLSCFMPVTQLKVGLADGMKVKLFATARLTKWGKFSLTVREIIPLGEGSIKKSFELLKKKLAAAGLFDARRKRPLPDDITKIGVISSTAAAGYADFIKILGERWGGLQVFTAHTQVQGLPAVEQIVRAFDYLNQNLDLDVIALVRGGGSADDLAIFNDERIVRAIAGSRIPVITGIGHEVDETLSDLVADVRASTPSNAAEYLTPDKQATLIYMQGKLRRTRQLILERTRLEQEAVLAKLSDIKKESLHQADLELRQIHDKLKILKGLDPNQVLRRGYAILGGLSANPSPGDNVNITTLDYELTTKIQTINLREKK